MSMEWICLTVSVAILAVQIVLLLRLNRASSGQRSSEREERIEREIRLSKQETMTLTQNAVSGLFQNLNEANKSFFEMQDRRLNEWNTLNENAQRRVGASLAEIRETLDAKLTALQNDNTKQLGEMRRVVDEKLQTTLEERISRSFKEVSERLEQVYRGLGEMQSLAAGVGDLKKVFSNVKTRGILGEIQLGAILEQILAPEQYAKNYVTVKGSRNPVEYAVKLPGSDDGYVYLPIDAKFPGDAYIQLCDAMDAADPPLIQAAGAALEQRVRQFAKEIKEKYIFPPDTTEFAVMFLPTEGLYAEVVRRGMIETLQREYHVTVAGPTTMAALLNSLQMGFKTLAIQKSSGEVWKVLGAVKTEFEKFEEVLKTTQQRLDLTYRELDKLVGTRTRQIRRQLSHIRAVPEGESTALLEREEESDES